MPDPILWWWVPIVGPLVGGVLGGYVYDACITRFHARERREGDAAPAERARAS